MRIMAIHAGIALAPAAGQVPVATHPAMQTLIVIPTLWTVALGAECDAIGELDGTAISHPQRVVVVCVVTAQAGQLAMRILEALMKLVEIPAIAQIRVGFCSRMTGTATGKYRLTQKIGFPGRYGRHAVRLSDDNRMLLNPRDRGSSRLRAAVGSRQKNPGQCRCKDQRHTDSQASHPRATPPGRARCAFIQSIPGERRVAHGANLSGWQPKPLDPGQCSPLL